jgi:Amt family ammonium transporter
MRTIDCTFRVIRRTNGLRGTAKPEEAGLDISEHGMYGYPEQFIPAPGPVGYAVASRSRDVPAPAPTTQEVPAS